LRGRGGSADTPTRLLAATAPHCLASDLAAQRQRQRAMGCAGSKKGAGAAVIHDTVALALANRPPVQPGQPPPPPPPPPSYPAPPPRYDGSGPFPAKTAPPQAPPPPPPTKPPCALVGCDEEALERGCGKCGQALCAGCELQMVAFCFGKGPGTETFNKTCPFCRDKVRATPGFPAARW